MTARLLAALLFLTAQLVTVGSSMAAPPPDSNCRRGECPAIDVGNGALTAAFVDADGGGSVATNTAPPNHPYTYRLRPPCVVSDEDIGACRPSDFQDCEAAPDRVVNYYVVERRRLVLDDGTTADGFVPPAGSSPGQQVGGWQETGRRCVDVTALNPLPSPGEVFRYFQTLPLPQLPTRQQLGFPRDRGGISYKE